MKKYLLISLFAGLVIGALNAQDQKNRYAEITNPNLIALNKEPARASFFSFNNVNESINAPNSSKGS
jgi:hypothetical protein